MDNNATESVGASVRFAGRDDVPTMLGFIRELAEYERMADAVVADERTLTEWMFDKGRAEAIIASVNGEDVGFALFFHNFSTWLGRAGLYLEDLYVRPSMRGRGIGGMLLRRLARIAVERGCGRMEWSCLDWNAPSIGFYRSLGARVMDEWTVYRLEGNTLHRLARGA